MDLRDYLDILRARWRLILTSTLLGVMAAALASMLATPLYSATSTVQIVINSGEENVGAAYTGQLLAQQQVKSYVALVTSEDVMDAVINDTNLNRSPAALAGQIDVKNPLDTVNLEITATDPNAATAQQIANSTAVQLQAAVDGIVPTNVNGDPLVEIEPLRDAALPTSPSSPRTLINLALGFLVGLAVGVGAAVLLETLDTRIKSIEMLAKYFDHPLLGVIGYEPEAEKKPLLTDYPVQSKRSESFRQVRTNLQFVDIDHRPKSIVVTSSVPREGKSTTAINLAITIAQTGQPVFLIEADLRRPKIADYLGIEGGAGLTDVLVGRATVDEVMQPWGSTGNLWVMASGPLPPNPSELLGSQAMSDLIHHLEKRATLIIDAPPLLPVTDAAVLTRLAGGALMVIATGKTRREQLRTGEQNIESVGGKILGLVLNMAPARGPDSHRYGYGYQYDYKTADKRGQFDDHPPVIPAGLGGLPGVNGSSTPTLPVGPVKADGAKDIDLSGKGSDASEPAAAAPRISPIASTKDEAPSDPRPAGAANVAASAPEVAPEPSRKKKTADAPKLAAAVPAEEKVIGSSAGVPLEAMLAPYVHQPPKVDLLPADTASGARFGLDDDVPLNDVHEVPVGDAVANGADVPADGWTPPAPRAALDPLTAPYEQVQRATGESDTPQA